ncbi:MAG TPA: helicase-related protein, partial [Candidatus Limnocylindrales bacterium]
IRRLADDFLDRPASVQVAPRNQATELVTQVVHPVDRDRKRELLSQLIKSGRIDQALVFTRTKHGANRLATPLEHDGILATAIHGNKSQPQSVRALADFKAGRFTVLVATEVAARGIDIDALPHVVNFELPMVPEDYVHRIGRTGRAGVDGDAVSLVCVDELKLLREIERVLGHPIPSETIEGFEPDPRIRPEPILRGGLGGVRPSGSGRIAAGTSRGARGPMGGARHQPMPAHRGPGNSRPPFTPPFASRQPAPDSRATGRTSPAFESGPYRGQRPSGAAQPGNAMPFAGAPRSVGPTRAPHSGGGHASPRRPGQGIGNQPMGRPGQAARFGQPGGARPAGAPGRSNPPRPAGAPWAESSRQHLPGERRVRLGGRRGG